MYRIELRQRNIVEKAVTTSMSLQVAMVSMVMEVVLKINSRRHGIRNTPRMLHTKIVCM